MLLPITNAPIVDLGLRRTWTTEDLPHESAALPDLAGLPADAEADIVCTSGTTGRPKGVVFDHDELIAGMGEGTETRGTGILLQALPFTGFGGCHGLLMSTLRFGNTLITQPRFEARSFLDLVGTRRPDTLPWSRR